MAVDRLGPDKVRRPKKVLFDSSFLIAVMEHPTSWQEDLLEIVGGFKGVVIVPVYSELVKLAGRGGRQSGFARLAIDLVDRGTLVLENAGGGRPDDELVSYALREGALVATIDHELMRQLKASHVRVVSLRGGRVESRQN